MNNKVFFGLLILVAGVFAGWYVFGGNPPSYDTLMGKSSVKETITPTSRLGQNDTNPVGTLEGESMEKGGAQARGVVTYTDTGFAPKPLTVKKGTTVTFVNESSRGMWVASAAHPTHQLLPGFDQLSQVAKGGSYEYTFIKVGTWTYHNHISTSDTGSVVVTE